MRKIKSGEEVERAEKRNKQLIGLFIIFLMFFSTASYAFFYGGNLFIGTEDAEIEDAFYNGQYWVYRKEEKEYYFTNQLESTQGVSVEISLNANNYAGKPLFLDSENEAVNAEISGNLGQHAPRIQRACFGECNEDLPEKDCSENLIVWKDGGANKVYQQDNCVFIEGDLLVVDAFLFKALGFS